MKIARLTFSGVRSYPDTCTIDFTGKTLIGILGDTGAGKTSILEAITAALYGKCSWTDRAAQLRSDHCDTMMIELVFSVEGRDWTVHRVFHESRPTQARLTAPDGKHTDGVRPVDDAIRKLIGIDYVTFKSSVLVPQGRFGDLLNAGDADRTRILKSLFGVDELQHVRQLATESAGRLKDLISQAQRDDARLDDDPRAAAQAARERHDRAQAGATDLSGRLTELRQLQASTAQAQQQARQSADAASVLAERRITDYGTTTAAVQQARDELEQLQETNAAAETTAQAHLEDVTAERETASAAGLAPDALAATAQVLKDAPGRLSTLADGETAHTRLLTELEGEEEDLAKRAGELEQAEQRIEEMRAPLQHAEYEATGAAEALQTMKTSVRRAGEAASALAQQRAAQARAHGKLTALVQAPPDSDLDVARAGARRAQDVLESIRRQEAAHTAGDGLAVGDGCPVCTGTLPEDYQPPQPHDAEALTLAKATADKALAALARAEREHTLHAHEVEQLQAAQNEHRQQVQEATRLLEDQLPLVRERARELAVRSAHPRPEVYGKELDSAAAAALSRMAAPTPPTAAEQEGLVDELLQDADRRVAQLQEAVVSSRNELAQKETALGAARASLQAATLAAEKRRAQALQTTERLESEQRSLLASLSTLPELVRAHLPQQHALPSSDHLKAATQALRREQSHQQELAQRQEKLRGLVHSLVAERGKLTERRQQEVTQPLHELRAQLQRWADSALSAAALVEEARRPVLPLPAGTNDPAVMEQYAARLEGTSTLLFAALDEHGTAARAAMAELRARLSAHAEAVAAAYPGSAVLQVDSETDPLEPTLLDGLSSQAGTLRNEAACALRDGEQALSQVPHKDRLTAAISAGERQLAAWQAVSAHLTDGKFLGHLTDLRTRALLAHGSELLQQLSGGRLGFAANFDIVNLSSRARRSSRTLSGGETFQASLALSLALMEMHGRSGTRLESLFLDEGFGTLDAARLDGALQVLRTHVGADKLLAVISHLRPVAETVHDVLWVEKDHRGSRAHWLSAAERDTLIREDLHNLADLT
ncbi:AAA family ATPase [Streptomyces sp. PR69]|uniref:AAA family ATPase n=1 Tax=Streptomyces sp. PR69 TaxID=2984950 RepID=UPI00226432CB|nr:SMC family ATPase [Streptomyces sp. PR69]